ncbi:hypothetical protein [Streptomyces sp. t39]|uniref:hypothetical protein n=1 Tax=Streptomyces sp. t39 TaxID=1828156 RepID=UPI00164FC901|nr:hypothetical protein [Streptomyces sp. t39]
MGWLTGTPKPKRPRAANPYTDWRAAPDAAGRKRRASHHRTGAAKADAAGWKWLHPRG